ncbi:MAG: ABC transporter substrate-binding protein [Candidatus Sumerlaeia bacterium]|nr:ABC transporter substrate-binding protein [Candidatus Sumerlaeia bacterium]
MIRTAPNPAPSLRALHAAAAIAAIALAPLAASAESSSSPNTAKSAPDSPFAKYLRTPIQDEFNEDVLAGDVGEPRRGGIVRMRTKVDFQEMNPITVTGQPERVVLNHASDALVDRDVSTYEEFPALAWHWRTADTLKPADGELQIGRIVSRDDAAGTITFVPGAWTAAYAQFDIANLDELTHGEIGTVRLRDGLEAKTTTGRIRLMPNTVVVDGVADPAFADATVTYKFTDLAVWKDEVSKSDRPFIKPYCAFEFAIRDGVTWHDGQPFTAEDVKFTYDVILNPYVDAAHLRNYYQDMQTSEVIDDGKGIRVVWGRPYFEVLSFVAGARHWLPKHVFNPEQFGGDDKAFGDSFNKHPFREKPVLTGPYKFKEWRKGQSLSLERNEDYWASKLPDGAVVNWRKQQPYLDGLTWVIIGDNNTAVRELEKQALDGDDGVEQDIWFSDATNTDSFKNTMTRLQNLGFGYVYIGWNLMNPIFKDKETRHALSMLVPAEEIAQRLHFGLAKPVSGPLYINGPGYDPSVEPAKYDPDKAKRLLRKAGWADRDKDGILEKNIDGVETPFRFSYMIHTAKDYHSKMADIVKERIGQAGIDVTISKLDWTIFSDTVRDKKFDAVRFAWSNTLDPDPYQIFHSSQIENRGDNFVSFRNARVDELCEKLREEFNPEKRWEMAREIHRIIAEEQPYCFLFAFYETYFFHRNLQGIKVYPSMYPTNLNEWYWAKEPPPGAMTDTWKASTAALAAPTHGKGG